MCMRQEQESKRRKRDLKELLPAQISTRKQTFLLVRVGPRFILQLNSSCSSHQHPRRWSSPGDRSRLAPTCRVRTVGGSDWGRITFPPKTNQSRICLGLRPFPLKGLCAVVLVCSVFRSSQMNCTKDENQPESESTFSVLIRLFSSHQSSHQPKRTETNGQTGVRAPCSQYQCVLLKFGSITAFCWLVQSGSGPRPAWEALTCISRRN